MSKLVIRVAVMAMMAALVGACQTTKEMMGAGADELEKKVVGKWQGKWGGSVHSTVDFVENANGGLNVHYCYQTQCSDLIAYAYEDNTIRISNGSATWVYNLKSADILHGDYKNSNGGYGVIDMKRIEG